jgi:hypothetical protein
VVVAGRTAGLAVLSAILSVTPTNTAAVVEAGGEGVVEIAPGCGWLAAGGCGTVPEEGFPAPPTTVEGTF